MSVKISKLKIFFTSRKKILFNIYLKCFVCTYVYTIGKYKHTTDFYCYCRVAILYIHIC